MSATPTRLIALLSAGLIALSGCAETARIAADALRDAQARRTPPPAESGVVFVERDGEWHLGDGETRAGVTLRDQQLRLVGRAISEVRDFHGPFSAYVSPPSPVRGLVLAHAYVSEGSGAFGNPLGSALVDPASSTVWMTLDPPDGDAALHLRPEVAWTADGAFGLVLIERLGEQGFLFLDADRRRVATYTLPDDELCYVLLPYLETATWTGPTEIEVEVRAEALHRSVGTMLEPECQRPFPAPARFRVDIAGPTLVGGGGRRAGGADAWVSLPPERAPASHALAAPRAEVTEPIRGSADRNAILDVARREIRRSGLSGRVEFQNVWVRRSGDWAFFSGDAARPGGSVLPSDYCDADPVVALLLRHDGSAWQVLRGGQDGEQHSYCVSDDSGYGWWMQGLDVPRDLFPPSPID